MRIADPQSVRAAFAAHLLGPLAPAILGDVTLYPHQVDAVRRLRRILDRHNGALLADDVGLGKTFVALALVAGREALVIAPAAVRDSWIASARRAGVAIRFCSMESLSRQAEAADTAPEHLVIIDEAHHFRSRNTRRFHRAGQLCAHASVLLLSATPLQNREGDLRAILSLFLGEVAFADPLEELTRVIVRRDESAVTSASALPIVGDPRWLDAPQDADCLDRIVALPPPVAPRDGGDGGVLVTYGLVRQWASSRGALVSALRRRRARGFAIRDALQSGSVPSRHELALWTCASDTQQLAFPGLLEATPLADANALLEQIGRHVDGVGSLLAWLRDAPDPDPQRALSIARVLREHGAAGERVVAFSEYTETVEVLFRLLKGSARIAMLTHSGGQVAGGTISRREVLSRFALGAGARATDSDRIDLLLTTDALSEGVGLHDASVVIHLDLPWNPARMQQRVGRLRRIGASRASIAVYAFAPSAPTERLLDLERRLRGKLALAARSMGLAGAILPGLVPPVGDAPSRLDERIVDAVRQWQRVDPPSDAVAAAVSAGEDGALACVSDQDGARLVAIAAEGIVTNRDVVARLVSAAVHGRDVVAPARVALEYEQRLLAWLRERTVTDVISLASVGVGRSRRRVLQRVDAIARRAPAHLRPSLAPLMRAARTAASATLSSGAERVLDELAAAELPDVAWLQAIGEFASLQRPDAQPGTPRVLALLVLVPG